MTFDRPKKPGKRNPAIQHPHPNNAPNHNNQRNHNAENLPPIWLKHPLEPNSTPNPDANAGFVEYLRWMRTYHDYENSEYNYENYKDIAKLQILQLAEENADYNERLKELNKRTKLIAGKDNYFEVTCPWRIRVGGQRGPESILLPAFDALGIPCILSSTLRGVARNQAIQQFIAEGNTPQQAETEAMKYFGGLDTNNKEDSMGKVIFLDAYPKPTNKSGGLSVDIVNNIWSWDNNNLNYKSNPQTFLSLKQSTFVIGIRPTSSCSNEILEKVKKWLIAGLQSGIGSQVNTGYGRLVSQNSTEHQHFFKVPFTIQGQLIHGKQKFVNLSQPYKTNGQNNLARDNNNILKANTSSDAEVRTIAFKSMLRYWFRVLSLGVLPISSKETTENYLKEFIQGRNTRPPAEVKALEAILFGSITPQARGWVQFQITEEKLVQSEAKSETDNPGEQSGILILNYSSEAPQERLDAINKLFTNLTWMMFHLGGVGQGARRPCYSRQGRNPQAKPPKWRGSTLIPESDDTFWKLPPTVKEFKRLFRQRLQAFYTALQELTETNINYQQPPSVSLKEAVDRNARIIVCTGEEDFNKPYALKVLHSQEFKINRNNQTVYDEILCGKSEKPSPVIIADLGDYQVVTVFGANQNKRQQYVQKLRFDTSTENYAQIFPFES